MHTGGLDSETFTTSQTFDALDRLQTQTLPDSTELEPGYDKANRLFTLDTTLPGASSATSVVTAIAYNARGQRTFITYGNDTKTTYSYDSDRHWVSSITTNRDVSTTPVKIQGLSYTRDASGNITQISDSAQTTEFFNNAQVSPNRTFVYDALYRLVEATGREKDSQTQTEPFWADYSFSQSSLPDSSAANAALRLYQQLYSYDPGGNITQMKHKNGGTTTWTRNYQLSSG